MAKVAHIFTIGGLLGELLQKKLETLAQQAYV
jgi:hypothetical protein